MFLKYLLYRVVPLVCWYLLMFLMFPVILFLTVTWWIGWALDEIETDYRQFCKDYRVA